MQYLITFLEGVISFISPCMLPMLPVYVSYFAPAAEDGEKSRVLPRAIAFVLGFTAVFTLLGLGAGGLGSALMRHQRLVGVICGVIVIVFGLSYLDVIPLPFFKGMQSGRRVGGVFSAFLFGLVYSLSLTPCVGAFLGSALMLASSTGGAVKGAMLLLVYSLGLGIPFVLSAVLLKRLGGAFSFIKKHYKTVNLICGVFLIAVGILMALGLMSKLTAIL